jgi:transposase InsO family protein
MQQLHKKFTNEQVRQFIQSYLNKEIKGKYLQNILGIKKTRFFVLVKQYQENPKTFSIQYHRTSVPRTIDKLTEINILKELSVDQQLITNKDVPLYHYNYSYIKERLLTKYKQKVSVPTIIDRAKKHNFYIKRHRKKKVHDREVLTGYAGELIQHDASIHLFAPAARKKWWLITSLDDYSRCILYARLVARQTAYSHIQGLETMFLKYGLPHSFYVDSHSIFRFVQQPNSIWRTHHTLTDQADPQWKQVLNDCRVKVIYALSPQAKGKIERPFGWLQDHLVRTCARDSISDIQQAQQILNREVYAYNHKRIHSTTEQIPFQRFSSALDNKKSLFRDFSIPAPFQSIKDIFCLRTHRTVDGYRHISLNSLQLAVPKALPGDKLNLRIYPLNSLVAELRIWKSTSLLDVRKIKNADLKGVHF